MSQFEDPTRDLFEAAKLDGPSEKSRDAMWASIHGATAGVTSVAAVKATGVASSKLALGIALGATLTIGIAATVIALTRPVIGSGAFGTTHVVEHGGRSLEHVTQNVDAPPPVMVTGHVVAQQIVQVPQVPQMSVELDKPATQAFTAQAAPTTTTTAQATRTATTTMSERDRLAREARMVSEARGALHRGEPETALRIVRVARSQAGARMVPEELTVEAQALRAMGDEVGARLVDVELAGKFPEQAISH